MESPTKCPRCHGEAVNKYGKTFGGKQRFICLVCNRQFVSDCPRQEIADRPLCPICGKNMHIYRTDKDLRRFRCSHYPKCRGYAKVLMKGE